MDLITLHELSMQLDVPVRVLRHRLRQLVQSGKAIEGPDYRRDEYVDRTHFIWKVNPESFTRLTGLNPVNRPDSPTPAPDNQSATQPDSQSTSASSAPAPEPYKTLPKVNTTDPSLEREMIDLLKDQVKVKDRQIGELTQQNVSLSSLNLKLTGQIVQQGERIQNLLRLTGGRSESDELDTQIDNRDTHSVTKPVNDSKEPVSQSEETGINDGEVATTIAA